MGISLKHYETNEILVVSTLEGSEDRMENIRIYLKKATLTKKTYL